jgi:hypothetical protein
VRLCAVATSKFYDYNDYDESQLPAYVKEPVFSNRHTKITHTSNENVKATSSNNDNDDGDEATAVSNELTVKEDSLIEESLLQQLRELIENSLCGGTRIDGDIVIEIDPIEKILKILPQSSLHRDVEEGK